MNAFFRRDQDTGGVVLVFLADTKTELVALADYAAEFGLVLNRASGEWTIVAARPEST